MFFCTFLSSTLVFGVLSEMEHLFVETFDYYIQISILLLCFYSMCPFHLSKSDTSLFKGDELRAYSMCHVLSLMVLVLVGKGSVDNVWSRVPMIMNTV